MKIKIPLSILIPTKNEEKNIGRCLESIAEWGDEIIIVDSKSIDQTCKIAISYGAKVVQFDYKGGWPKKRQWAIETYPFRNEWILLLDSDEILLPSIKDEIEKAIAQTEIEGYWIPFNIYFLGRLLHYGSTRLFKLSLFKKGKGRYEKRITNQDISMGDMEIHEHVIVDGKVGFLKSPVKHENFNSLDRYIQKHNEYSNWEASVYWQGGNSNGINARFWGTQAEHRRWLRKRFMRLPALPVFVFIYFFFLRLGFLDGKVGLIYNLFRAVQFFHIKAKIYEKEITSQ